jgi:hypothetical protein
MPDRITTYQQAFIGVLGIPLDGEMQQLVRSLEKEGHTEKGISFSIWRSQDKLNAFKNDKRFIGILRNEINKWSWKKDDPRWIQYWNRKNEAVKAGKIRKEIDDYYDDKYEIEAIEERAKKPSRKFKGYVYFIQGLCGGAIKIGYSASPEKRLKQIQTGYPDTLAILLMIPGNENTERTLHRQLEGAKLKGEWFRPDTIVIDKIKELKVKFHGNKN